MKEELINEMLNIIKEASSMNANKESLIKLEELTLAVDNERT